METKVLAGKAAYKRCCGCTSVRKWRGFKFFIDSCEILEQPNVVLRAMCAVIHCRNKLFIKTTQVLLKRMIRKPQRVGDRLMRNFPLPSIQPGA